MPLLLDRVTGEPYIQLPAPHASVRITPPRSTDAPAITAMMNDPRVYSFLIGPPHPYIEQHAVGFLKFTKVQCDTVLAEIQPSLDAGLNDFVASGCPVKSIREVHEDGSQTYIGDITIDRNGFVELEISAEERKALSDANEAKRAGDPSIVWTVGDCLASSHHGRGIMSAALRAIIDEWAVPHLRAERIVVNAFSDNIGSHRVFTKNGFICTGTIRGTHMVDEMASKGRTDCRLTVFEWRRSA